MREVTEPSVEEILESIKKVIARDTHAHVEVAINAETAPVQDAEDAQDENDDDILDLTESAALSEPAEEFTVPEPVPGDSPLLAEDTRSSMRESFAALAMLAEPGAPPQIVRSGETSLEGLTRELLRPALTEWLDKNLPDLVERMVASEISRIVGKRG